MHSVYETTGAKDTESLAKAACLPRRVDAPCTRVSSGRSASTPSNSVLARATQRKKLGGFPDLYAFLHEVSLRPYRTG